jgi:hypothetical protein
MQIIALVLAGVVALALVAVLAFVYVVQNVEQPDYRALISDGDFELRAYPPLVVAEVTRPGDRTASLKSGFGPLARYIFARDRAGPGIAMTAPVTQEPALPRLASDAPIAMTAPVLQSAEDAGDAAWTVRFVMPAEHALADLPAPGDPALRLRELPARTLAAVRFSGRTTDSALAAQEQRLRAWMQARGLTPAAAPVYAYYNDPRTPPFLRRNEVLIETSPEAADAR